MTTAPLTQRPRSSMPSENLLPAVPAAPNAPEAPTGLAALATGLLVAGAAALGLRRRRA